MTSAVEVVAIGNELVLGETVDTNTPWLARRLAREGIRVVRATVVGDDIAAIRDAVEAALHRSRTVICTGGLGPTTDDLTRAVIAELYGREEHIDEGWLAVLRDRYRRRNIPMPEINRVQALLPEGGELLHNARGTAPGILLDDSRLGLVVLLPGVPSEMRGLVEDHVVARLRERLQPTRAIESRVLRTTSISEAALAERIADAVADVAPLTIAFLPGLAGVDIRLTHWGDAGPAAAAAAFTRVSDALRARLGAHVYADGDVELTTVVGQLLRQRGLRLAVAESCTGGLLAKKLTDDAGSSDYMSGGVVAYANEVKRDHLGVREETLALYGAVSEECASEMALGARGRFGADAAISITGIAGPTGGSPDKPIGLVWFAVALSDALAAQLQCATVTARSFIFPGNRSEIRERSAQAALDLLRRKLQRAGVAHAFEPAQARSGHAAQ